MTEWTDALECALRTELEQPVCRFLGNQSLDPFLLEPLDSNMVQHMFKLALDLERIKDLSATR